MKVIFNKGEQSEKEFEIYSAREQYFINNNSYKLVILLNSSAELMAILTDYFSKNIINNIVIVNNYNKELYNTNIFVILNNLANYINDDQNNYIVIELTKRKNENEI